MTILTGRVSGNKVLTADQRGLDVVNPDEVSAIQSNSIATPDVLGIQLRNVDILDDNVACTIANTQTLAANNTRAANTNNGLVGGYINTLDGSLIISTGEGRVITAPIGGVKINGILAGAATGVR